MRRPGGPGQRSLQPGRGAGDRRGRTAGRDAPSDSVRLPQPRTAGRGGSARGRGRGDRRAAGPRDPVIWPARHARRGKSRSTSPCVSRHGHHVVAGPRRSPGRTLRRGGRRRAGPPCGFVPARRVPKQNHGGSQRAAADRRANRRPSGRCHRRRDRAVLGHPCSNQCTLADLKLESAARHPGRVGHEGAVDQ